MSRSHALAVVVLLAVNAVVGSVALARTLHLGQTSQQGARKVSSRLIAERSAQLDRFEASLRAQLAKKPPRLPKAPSAAASAASVPSVAAATSAPRIEYVRPAPIVVHRHRPGVEYEGDEADGGAADD